MCLGSQALAKVIDDLLLEFIAAGAPAARASQLFDATAQAAKPDEMRWLAESRANFVAQTGKEEQLQTLA